jgi:response regulator NasT
MTSVIVVLPKLDDAKSIKAILNRSGIPVAGICTTGAQALALADGLNYGIVICGYKMTDMMYSELHADLPFGFDMLLMASRQFLEGGMTDKGIVSLAMPLKVNDLLGTVDMMVQTVERRKRKQREKPRERKQEEVELIKQAKGLLMERNHMTEEEAHRYIQKCSMDSGTYMVETAQMVLTMMKEI